FVDRIGRGENTGHVGKGYAEATIGVFMDESNVVCHLAFQSQGRRSLCFRRAVNNAQQHIYKTTDPHSILPRKTPYNVVVSLVAKGWHNATPYLQIASLIFRISASHL